MSSKSYNCVCGRVFDNPQSFNGHKGHCKIHQKQKYGNLDYLNELNAKRRRNLDKGRETQATLRNIKQEEANRLWVSEKHICKNCGKIMSIKYASGDFCSRACANTRIHTEETKNKISEGVRSNFEYINYNGKEITAHEYKKILGIQQKIEKKKLDIRNKHSKLFKKYKVMDSPYSDYDSLYLYTSKEGEVGLQFIKHNEEGQITQRALVSEYRYIIEKEMGRKLLTTEVVHHIDGNHYNNRRKNLIVLTPTIHHRIHKNLITIEEVIKNKLYIYK